MKTLYLVQHLQPYQVHDQSIYDAKAKLLREAGFIRCRSEPDGDGRYWEVWLGHDFQLAIHGFKSKQDVMHFLTWKIGPGEISVAQELEHWGASPD